MPGLFANGSTVLDAPMSTRPAAPAQIQQPADQYYGQQYRTNDGDMTDARRRLSAEPFLQRGYAAAGFVRVGRHGDAHWERQQPASYPERLPAHARTTIERAIAAMDSARAAYAAAQLHFAQWERDNSDAPDEERRGASYRVMRDPARAATRALDQLDQIMAALGVAAKAIEDRDVTDQAAPARRAAADRQHQAALNQIETEQMTARMAEQQAIARF